MNLIPRSPFWDIDNIFENFVPTMRDWRSSEGVAFSPSVDISEAEDSYIVKADLPGVKKEDVSVTMNDGVLTLEAEHRYEKEEKEKGKVIRSERRVGKFLRSFTVGRDVKEEDIGAVFEDGVLTLSIPKVEQRAPESHRITIQ